jgi:hypothetical protein
METDILEILCQNNVSPATILVETVIFQGNHHVETVTMARFSIYNNVSIPVQGDFMIIYRATYVLNVIRAAKLAKVLGLINAYRVQIINS